MKKINDKEMLKSNKNRSMYQYGALFVGLLLISASFGLALTRDFSTDGNGNLVDSSGDLIAAYSGSNVTYYEATGTKLQEAVWNADKVIIPANRIIPSSTLVLGSNTSNITLMGMGKQSIIQLGNNVDDDVIRIDGAENVTLTNFMVDGNSGNNAYSTGYNGIDAISSSHHLTIDNVFIYDTICGGIDIDDSDNPTVVDCTLYECGNGAPSYNGVRAGGVWFEDCNYVTCSRNTIHSFFGDGIVIEQGAGTCENFIISDNHIYDGFSGIWLESAEIRDGVISNNVIHDLWNTSSYPLADGNNYGIITSRTTGSIIVSNNVVYNMTNGAGYDSYAINIHADHATITDNSVYDIGNESLNGEGIRFSCSGICSGNIINNTRNVGIRFYDYVDEDFFVDISNNIVTNSGTTGIYTDGTDDGTKVKIEGNIINNTGIHSAGDSIKITFDGTISNNVVHNSTSYGIWVVNGNSIINGNRITGNFVYDGINAGSNSVCSNNFIDATTIRFGINGGTNATISGNKVFGDGSSTGIYAKNDVNSTITENKLSGHTYGIIIDGTYDSIIQLNTITETTHGIYIWADGGDKNNYVANNNLYYATNPISNDGWIDSTSVYINNLGYNHNTLFPFYEQNTAPSVNDNCTAYWYDTDDNFMYQVVNTYGTVYYVNMTTTI